MKGSFSDESVQAFKAVMSDLHGLDYSEAEMFDFTRCVRPNGSVYGTGGTCRKGTQTDKNEQDAMSQLAGMLPKGEKIVGDSGKVHTVGAKGKLKKGPTEENLHLLTRKLNQLDEKLSQEKGLLGRMSKKPQFDALRKVRAEKVQKLVESRTKVAKARTQFQNALEKEAKETGAPRSLMPTNWKPGS